MNYSMRLKSELILGAPRKACCKAAYARGLFLNAAQTKSGNILLSVSSLDARMEIARLYRDLYRGEALMERNTLLFSSKKLYDFLTKTEYTPHCAHCAAHFLRGAVIAAGTMTDPQKSYHLEIKAEEGEGAEFLSRVLLENGWAPKQRTHRTGTGIYIKNSAAIEEILTFLGATNALFELMNAKIVRDIRNEENRATNCVTRNITRSVDAAGRTLEAIERIRAAMRFETLPSELAQTARLREEMPAASLFELAKAHNPPLTKSGLNHRLQKLISFADSLQKEK